MSRGVRRWFFVEYKEYKQHAESRSAEIERMKAEQTSLATQLSDTRKKYDSMQDEWREKEIQHMKLTTEYEFLQKEREKLKEDYEKQQQTLDEFLKQQQYPYPSVNAFLPPTPRMYSVPKYSTSLNLIFFQAKKTPKNHHLIFTT